VVRRTLRRSRFAAVLLLVAGTGFSTPLLFAEPVHTGGGGGRFFTGSPRDGFGCEVCHQGADAPVIDVQGLGDGYEPGLTFTLQMTWPQEARDIGLIGEVVDANGDTVGTLATPPDDLIEDVERCAGGNLAVRVVDAEDDRQLFGVPACGASALRVQWTAPDEDVGPVWFHVGAVGSDASDDAEGDGVWMWARELTSPAGPIETEGCHVGAPTRGAGWCMLLLVALFARRRRTTHGTKTTMSSRNSTPPTVT